MAIILIISFSGSNLTCLQCGNRLYSSESDVCRRQIKIDPRTVRVKFLMNQKELTKTLISNWKKTFGLHGLYKIFQRFKG